MSETETTVQNALYRWLRASNRWPILPNVDCITGYEADMLTVTNAGYVYEYEIKLSLSDYRADLKKVQKHASLSGRFKTVPYPLHRFADAPETINVISDCSETNPYKIYSARCHPEWRPKQFWYVICGFDVDQIPEYAGLMKYADRRFETIKKAPNLEAKPANPSSVNHALNNMLFRYWNLRTKTLDTPSAQA